VRVSSWLATILLLLSVVAVATSANISGYLAPESSPQSGFLCTFTSSVSPSTITPETASVTISGADTCDPTGSYLWAALIPGNPQFANYQSDPCDPIKIAVSEGLYSYNNMFTNANDRTLNPNNNPDSQWNYAFLWYYFVGLNPIPGESPSIPDNSEVPPGYSVGYGGGGWNNPPSGGIAYSIFKNFAPTDSSGQFSGNYPTSSLKQGSYCIVLQVPCQVSIPSNGFWSFVGVYTYPLYDNLNVVESSSPGTSATASSTSSTPFCFTCYIFTSATSSSSTCSVFLCGFFTISQPPAVTNTLPPATMIQTQTLPPTAVVETDWAVLSVSMNPPSPAAGQTVIFGMEMTAIWSSGSFPQNVYVRCLIDGANCGRGQVSYTGPIGSPFQVNANHPLASNSWDTYFDLENFNRQRSEPCQ